MKIRHGNYFSVWLVTALFATLSILIALLIVFSSDPGNPDDYPFWP